MGKRNELFHRRGETDKSYNRDLSVAQAPLEVSATDMVDGMYVQLKKFQAGYNGPAPLAQKFRVVGGKRVIELRDDIEFLDRMGIAYVGKYGMMVNGMFDHFLTLDEAIMASHQHIEPFSKDFGNARDSIIFGWLAMGQSIQQMYAFFVGPDVYITDSRWLANQLSGNNCFTRYFTVIDGKVVRLAQKSDYGEGDEEIIVPSSEDESMAEV